MLYGTSSVMENHHCSVAVHVLTQEENDILSALAADDAPVVWKSIINTILSTDLARYGQHMKKVYSSPSIISLAFNNLSTHSQTHCLSTRDDDRKKRPVYMTPCYFISLVMLTNNNIVPTKVMSFVKQVSVAKSHSRIQ